MKKIVFNEYVKTFPHKIFGDLTVIKSNKEEDTYWFIGNEIQNVLGFKKLRNAINDADLDHDEVLHISKKNNEDFFKNLNSHLEKVRPFNGHTSEDPIISKFAPSITLIRESGLYGLAMTSRKPIAKDFRRAIRKDILPGVRKLFEKYKEVKLNTDIVLHLDVDYQKINSKWFNYMTHNIGGGHKAMIENRNISLKHTGKTPSKWKEEGKEEATKRGIAPSSIASGLDGMRLLEPEQSASISQHKQLLRLGISDDSAFMISDKSKEVFKLMIDSGVKPNELGGRDNEK